MQGIHDALRHLRYLRQSLSQDNESIGFFISAGCPLSVPMPDGTWPLIPDVENLSKYINDELKTSKEYVLLLGEITKAGKNPNNVEDVLSFIRSLFLVSKGVMLEGLVRKIFLIWRGWSAARLCRS